MFSFDESKLIARRRFLHTIPELLFQERETQEFVLKELSDMGLRGTRIASTGVIVRLGPPQSDENNAIALRADMDGLPMQGVFFFFLFLFALFDQPRKELADVPYKSTKANVMHACGHDGHVASMLSVAETIKDWPLKRPVVLLFQPAEEGGHGAREMVKEARRLGLGCSFPSMLTKPARVA
jgi:amidohydrolase